MSPPSWHNMPNKGQLAILALSRFVDFFQMSALQTFMVHQLQSFDPTLSSMAIAHQAGVLQGSFTAAQIITSILWGRIADHPTIGRKTVLVISLIGNGIGCVGLAFSNSYGQAVFWRLLSGAVNGSVSAARTMVAEGTPKAWHPRAFLLLPAAFNIANVAGPLLAGVLVDPFVNFPGLFGVQSLFGGEAGLLWMKAYPFAAANLLSAALLFAEALLVHFCLIETLKSKQPFDSSSINVAKIIPYLNRQMQTVRRSLGSLTHEQGWDALDRPAVDCSKERPAVQGLPFRHLWTSNVCWTLLSTALFDFHMGAFVNLWVLLLATPRDQNAPSWHSNDGHNPDQVAPFTRSIVKFSSGLAFPPLTIGKAMAIIGYIGVALQFLLYPWANSRFGLMRCFRFSLLLFPIAYTLAPFIALLPSSSAPQGPATGCIIWSGISLILLIQVAARTFALPASIILLNNSSPHPSVLGTVHGLGSACSATARTLGPMLSGYWYGIWMTRGVLGVAWWFVAAIAALGCVASFWVRNGSGHEIFLPGEEAEMKETEAGDGSGDGR